MFKIGRVPLALFAAFAIAVLPLGYGPPAVHAGNSSSHSHINCAAGAIVCTEVHDSELAFGEGVYVGHDEPSNLFYSNTPGSGNSNVYRLTLPTDPKQLPSQDGTGGTFNFQLHPAFWFGMTMCDTQSFPEFTSSCTPNNDSNIFDSANPADPHYIGRHPGTAFMEMQFYPPGWVAWPPGNSCDATKWCAALNIDSLSENPNTGQDLNSACQAIAGLEYVNFAFITKNGVAQAPANPVQSTLATFTPDPSKDLFMNSGDILTVDMHDTAAGFQVVIHDVTTGQSGSMTASEANSFGQVQFAPPPSTACTNIPYNFHPMYSTSSEHTRVPWAAHSYNIAFSDEIGHFEYCNAVDPNTGNCTAAGVNDPSGVDGDDNGCFNPSDSTRVLIGGCLGSDLDFDGPEYTNNWPGTGRNQGQDQKFHASPVEFTSPLANGTTNFDRVAFETDLPRIEFATTPPCQRHVSNPADPNPGQGCVNPPAGASFYPFYTTGSAGKGCVWQLGGADIHGTTNTFGGSSAAEYGGLLLLAYPTPTGPSLRYNNFRRVLSSNPCPASSGG
jgi:hypothetical protein